MVAVQREVILHLPEGVAQLVEQRTFNPVGPGFEPLHPHFFFMASRRRCGRCGRSARRRSLFIPKQFIPKQFIPKLFIPKLFIPKLFIHKKICRSNCLACWVSRGTGLERRHSLASASRSIGSEFGIGSPE